MDRDEQTPPLRLLLVPGVKPGKWVARWRERYPELPLEVLPVDAADAVALLADGAADLGFVRLPVAAADFHVIPLWTEETVVVVGRDDDLASADELEPGDLEAATVIVPEDDVLAWTDGPGRRQLGPAPVTTGDAVELVAAGGGVLVVPASLARDHHRKDVRAVPLRGGPVSQVGLAWPQSGDDERIQEFVGVVRGRTANSSRGPRRDADDAPAPATTPQPRPGGRSGGSRGSLQRPPRRGSGPRRPRRR